MKKTPKFRKNNWLDEEPETNKVPNSKQKRLDRALKTRDVDYLSRYGDEDL